MKSLPGAISPDVRKAIQLCLRKDLNRRIADIRDVKFALEGEFETGPSPVTQKDVPARPLWRRMVPISAALVAAALLAAGLTWSLMRPASPVSAPISRFVITPPATSPLANIQGYDVAVSPDGKRGVYISQDPQTTSVRLYVRDLDGLSVRAFQARKSRRLPEP